MFCTNCGNEVEQHARFCSKCGREIVPTTPPAAAKKTEHDMAMHINILAWLLIGSGILTGIGALAVMFAGQVMRHLPFLPPDMPAGMPQFVSWIATVVGLGLAALAAGVAAAGVGLLQYREWARTLTIIMAVFLLFHFPIGTAVAIYAFWVLFSREGEEYYKTRSAGTMAVSGS
jgi:zinc-ribbon domain